MREIVLPEPPKQQLNPMFISTLNLSEVTPPHSVVLLLFSQSTANCCGVNSSQAVDEVEKTFPETAFRP